MYVQHFTGLMRNTLKGKVSKMLLSAQSALSGLTNRQRHGNSYGRINGSHHREHKKVSQYPCMDTESRLLVMCVTDSDVNSLSHLDSII